ncbi:hypothetical protein UFOVP78_23 [uncultured Caudovirales phage]|uniref:Uncharacterized protein n=1 Tax=uncultured Caudovirales phage TaxID=2100421 RepID=A0A6J5L0R6_9CAUD|nr:hypothetical protein UFOVP78_23 [uncultured Caudovirales phage]
MIPAPRIAPPAISLADPGRAMTELRAWGARCGREAPAWAYDPEYVSGRALDILPRVCAEIGTGEAICTLPRPAWWSTPMPAEDRARHGAARFDAEPHFIVFRAKPGSYAVLVIHRSTGEWECPAATRRGENLVELAAWRWRTTPAKAAWRLGKLCGLRRPLAA